MADLFAPEAPASTSTVAVADAAKTCRTCGCSRAGPQGLLRCEHLPVWSWMGAKSSCSFTPTRWIEITPQTKAKRDAQAGIDNAVAAAEHHHEGWTETAYAFIELYCAQNKGKRCIGRDLVEASVAKGVIQPPNPKAWGGPIQRAARTGLLKRVGFHEDDNRHGAPVPLWEVA